VGNKSPYIVLGPIWRNGSEMFDSMGHQLNDYSLYNECEENPSNRSGPKDAHVHAHMPHNSKHSFVFRRPKTCKSHKIWRFFSGSQYFLTLCTWRKKYRLQEIPNTSLHTTNIDWIPKNSYVQPTAKADLDEVDIIIWAPSARVGVSTKKLSLQFYQRNARN
jgi:hypothetical protein